LEQVVMTSMVEKLQRLAVTDGPYLVAPIVMSVFKGHLVVSSFNAYASEIYITLIDEYINIE